MSLLSIIYSMAAIALAIYGFNSVILTLLYLRHRHKSLSQPTLKETPPVTVQLPICNEELVVERLIDAAAHLDYPRDKLQIQVLDDSTDETTAIALSCISRYQAQGLDIELIRRPDRSGFKAGALAYGLRLAKGDFIAIFDADFVPPPDFLQATIPHFQDRPGLGLIQTRWGHLNADYSPLTRAQALALDGLFVVEQTARHHAGLFMNFNGTAGVLRKSCIEEAGGWQGDTVSEDLDLSYRVQLLGWQCLYLPQVVALAEIPPQVAALKRQQFRWAKGSIQVLCKLGGRVIREPAPLFKRFQALLHMSSSLAHPLMLILLLSTLPLMLGHSQIHLPLVYLSLASLGPPLLSSISQRALYPDWRRRLVYLPTLAFLGTGLVLSNTQAVLEALFGRDNVFQRTPKFDIRSPGDDWMGSRYVLPASSITAGELVLSLYALLTAGLALVQGNTYAVAFLLLYASGSAYIAGLDLWQTRPGWWPSLRALWETRPQQHSMR